MAATNHASVDPLGSVFLIDGSGKILRLPIPSRSTKDPLNWSTLKRGFAIFSLIFFAIIGLVPLLGLNLVYTAVTKEYATAGIHRFFLHMLLSAPTLFMGLGGFLWIPLSLAVGRRPVFLACSLLLLVSTAWAAFARSYYQILFAVCLQGLAISIRFSTMLLMIIDLTFIAQRPQAIAMFWCPVAICSFAIQTAIPAVIDDNWRVFYRALIIPSACAVVFAFLCYPETYFQRPAVAFNGRVLVQSATEQIHIYDDWEEVPGGKPLPNTPLSRWRDFATSLKIWTAIPGGWKAMGVCYVQILLCFLNPLILWVTLLNTFVFGGLIVMSTTYVQLLTSRPYSLSPQSLLLINVAAILGAALGWPTAGIMTAKVCRRLVMRNSGVRDAEYYLPGLIFPTVASFVSLMVYGIAGARHWHYAWILVAWALNNFAVVTLFIINTLWVTEAFPRWAAAAIAIVGSGSSATSFAISFVIGPWIRSQGFEGSMSQIAGLVIVTGLFAFPVAYWGRRYRGYMEGKWAMHQGGSLRPQVVEEGDVRVVV